MHASCQSVLTDRLPLCFRCCSARAFERLGTHCLSLVSSADRAEAEGEWGAMQMFADALNKKFGRAIMRKETHESHCTRFELGSVTHHASVASSVPPVVCLLQR